MAFRCSQDGMDALTRVETMPVAERLFAGVLQ